LILWLLLKPLLRLELLLLLLLLLVVVVVVVVVVVGAVALPFADSSVSFHGGELIRLCHTLGSLRKLLLLLLLSLLLLLAMVGLRYKRVATGTLLGLLVLVLVLVLEVIRRRGGVLLASRCSQGKGIVIMLRAASGVRSNRQIIIHALQTARGVRHEVQLWFMYVYVSVTAGSTKKIRMCRIHPYAHPVTEFTSTIVEPVGFPITAA
jgi:hypothetical protein